MFVLEAIFGAIILYVSAVFGEFVSNLVNNSEKAAAEIAEMCAALAVFACLFFVSYLVGHLVLCMIGAV